MVKSKKQWVHSWASRFDKTFQQEALLCSEKRGRSAFLTQAETTTDAEQAFSWEENLGCLRLSRKRAGVLQKVWEASMQRLFWVVDTEASNSLIIPWQILEISQTRMSQLYFLAYLNSTNTIFLTLQQSLDRHTYHPFSWLPEKFSLDHFPKQGAWSQTRCWNDLDAVLQ